MQKIFLNISNHPSTKWSDEQLKAAQKYGEVIDIQFPQVPADEDAVTVYNLANMSVKNLLRLYKDADITIHIMGEMTFTYAFVHIAKAHSIPCLASTTERIATEKDGVKTSIFQFVQFRQYIQLETSSSRE